MIHKCVAYKLYVRRNMKESHLNWALKILISSVLHASDFHFSLSLPEFITTSSSTLEETSRYAEINFKYLF